ncbi:hypothetical protein BAUCODRAFT_567438 [Baudoinia panamericana UAMH 10762]|uniref:Tyrosine specific protein phosphatases domain-containing protein n=1 Tax=Baudoinia panamericana (strain UAMH 10762) TaxID=717646 RepID=M2MQV4_BAUPA|nr:uncharacterized protein BAUCODRAFT_567438 [Baudoinia panamericana UAMH 10762]EMC93858.1 hypothetical protein BAUCODRAFT_567438 [Baudoinia panamericana UAMH 10762]
MADALPSPPFIDIAGIHNFRGIGGEHAGPGLVYRSADPSKATRTGLQKMSQDLGIRTVFDLRSAPEIRREVKEWANVAVDDPEVFKEYGITREWVPVFAEKDYGPEQVAIRYKEYTRSGSEGFVKAYHDILISGAKSYSKIFRYMAQDKPSPLLVHCTAGKDRTGVFIALLFMLTGASDDEIAREYSLTDLGLKELKPVFIERILQNPAVGANRAGVENMVSSKKENMLATLQMIRKDFGSAEAYMKKYCGLSDTEIDKVRRNVTEGALVSMGKV